MIFNALVSFLVGTANFIISLFPSADSSITSQITSNLTNFRNAMSAISWFFPVNVALSLLAIVLTIEGSILLWKLTRWVASIFTAGLIK